MSQPIANVGLPWYINKCGKKKQYLCAQSMGGTSPMNATLNPNQALSFGIPSTVLPVPTKIYFSGYATLSPAVPVNVYFKVYNIYGQSYPIYINWELQNNGTVIYVPEQEIVLEPYAFTTGTGSGLTIVPSATVTISAVMYAYIEVSD